MLQYLSNAFNDPSNPWYYVIGLLFLLAIFGALAVYVIFSGKKKSDEQNKDEQADKITQNAETSESEASASETEGEGKDTVSEPKEDDK